MSYSFRSIIDGGSDSDLIYYNATITSAKTSDVQAPLTPTPVKFNETRDAPILKDASQYYFSIIRFAMNGPNKNLPLFIPLIQTNGFSIPTQFLVNLTVYYASIGYQREWNYTDTNNVARTKVFTITPYSTPLEYIPETQNIALAPVPRVPPGGIKKQDLSTRYYWVYTYKHWVTLVNNTFLKAMEAAYNEFSVQWAADTTIASPFPYTDFNAFLEDHDTPFMKYNEESHLFEIYGDTRAFNISSQITYSIDTLTGGTQPPLPPFTAPVYNVGDPASAASTAYLRLFFNDNLFGLFTNFNNTYFGATGASSILWANSPTPIQIGKPNETALLLNQYIYTNEILFTNQNYTNILNNNPLLQNNNVLPPPVYNPLFLIPTRNQALYWIIKQDYPSTNSLWSPIASLVFTSSLMPLKKEFTAKPIALDQGNVNTATGSQSAFEPIITDYVIDQQIERAEGWRDFVLYEPTAEYRMISMTASHEEIRNIDVQVFWKYRLTGELIPLTMFNASDVTIKMMFRKIDYRS